MSKLRSFIGLIVAVVLFIAFVVHGLYWATQQWLFLFGCDKTGAPADYGAIVLRNYAVNGAIGGVLLALTIVALGWPKAPATQARAWTILTSYAASLFLFGFADLAVCSAASTQPLFGFGPWPRIAGFISFLLCILTVLGLLADFVTKKPYDIAIDGSED